MYIFLIKLNFIEEIGKFLNDCVHALTTAIRALYVFYDSLKEFDDRIVVMVENCGSTEIDGLPVIKAIATYRYVVGDAVFYLMYVVVLFGCLITVWKLVLLIIHYFMKLLSFVKEFFAGTKFASSISNLFRGSDGII